MDEFLNSLIQTAIACGAGYLCYLLGSRIFPDSWMIYIEQNIKKIGHILKSMIIMVSLFPIIGFLFDNEFVNLSLMFKVFPFLGFVLSFFTIPQLRKEIETAENSTPKTIRSRKIRHIISGVCFAVVLLGYLFLRYY